MYNQSVNLQPKLAWLCFKDLHSINSQYLILYSHPNIFSLTVPQNWLHCVTCNPLQLVCIGCTGQFLEIINMSDDCRKCNVSFSFRVDFIIFAYTESAVILWTFQSTFCNLLEQLKNIRFPAVAHLPEENVRLSSPWTLLMDRQTSETITELF